MFVAKHLEEKEDFAAPPSKVVALASKEVVAAEQQ
jgi:hypothetical protein